MTTATVFTKAEAKAHDAIVAEQFGKFRAAAGALEAAYEEGHRAVGDRQVRVGGKNSPALWQLRRYQVLAQLRRSDFDDRGLYGRIMAARDAFEAAEAELDRLEQVRVDHGNWQRFYLVTGGHIHASRHCHTLRVSTQIGWLPNLSGETEESAVAEHGPLLCTVCFPSAPVEWTIGHQAPADQCPGSGTWDYPAETARKGYCSGNYGVCSHCDQRTTISSTGKMRKHKRS